MTIFYTNTRLQSKAYINRKSAFNCPFSIFNHFEKDFFQNNNMFHFEACFFLGLGNFVIFSKIKATSFKICASSTSKI